MTPYHPLTATVAPPEGASVIWPWPNNWGDPFTQRIAYKTAVMPTAAGKEQRQALREIPREVFVVNNLLEHPDSATALSLLRAWKGKKWLVPGWHEMAHTTAPAGQILSLDRYSCRPGLALLGTEVVTIASTSGALDAPPVGNWPAGTTLVPLYEATLDEDQSTEFVTRGVARLSLAFEVTEGRAVPRDEILRYVWPEDRTVLEANTQLTSGRFGGAVRVTPGQTVGSLTIGRAGGFPIEGPQTLEFWVYFPVQPEGNEAVLDGGNSGYVTALPSAGGKASVAFTNFPGTNSAVGLPLQVWHHIALVRREDNRVAIFVNGASTGFSSVPQTPIGRTAAQITLFSGTPGRTTFTGLLDDVRLTDACRYLTDFTPEQCPVGPADPYWPQVQFLMTGDRSRWASTLPVSADPYAARNHHIPDDHDWASAASVAVVREVDVLDVPEGSRHTRPREAHSTARWSMGVHLPDHLQFRAWLQMHRGSAISFFAAVPGADVTIAAQSGGSLTVPELRFYSDPSPFVGISLLVAGEWEAHLFSGRPVGTAVALATTPSGPATVGRLITRARLMGDEVEIRYHHLGLAEVILPITTVVE